MRSNALTLLFLLLVVSCGRNAAGEATVIADIAASWPAPTLGIVVDQSTLEIMAVDSNSNAEEAGLRRGDILKSIENTSSPAPTQGMYPAASTTATSNKQRALEQAKQAVHASKPSDKIRIVISRDGQEVEMVVSINGRKTKPNQPTVTPLLLNQGYDYF